jgi:hypothetical protein
VDDGGALAGGDPPRMGGQITRDTNHQASCLRLGSHVAIDLLPVDSPNSDILIREWRSLEFAQPGRKSKRSTEGH